MKEIPVGVQIAMKVEFGLPITGYLSGAIYSPPVILGVIYHDRRGRFLDGTAIHTSTLHAAVSAMGYWVVKTRSGSVYVVTSWHHEGCDLNATQTYH